MLAVYVSGKHIAVAGSAIQARGYMLEKGFDIQGTIDKAPERESLFISHKHYLQRCGLDYPKGLSIYPHEGIIYGPPAIFAKMLGDGFCVDDGADEDIDILVYNRSKLLNATATTLALSDVLDERARQDAMWGISNYPLGLGEGDELSHQSMLEAQRICNEAADNGLLDYRKILTEEVYELFAAKDLDSAEEEAVQVSALALKIVERIRRIRLANWMSQTPTQTQLGKQ